MKKSTNINEVMGEDYRPLTDQEWINNLNKAQLIEYADQIGRNRCELSTARQQLIMEKLNNS